MRLQSTLCLGLLLAIATAAQVHANNSKFTELEGNPGLRSASAIVLDSDGNVIYGKDVDTVGLSPRSPS